MFKQRGTGDLGTAYRTREIPHVQRSTRGAVNTSTTLKVGDDGMNQLVALQRGRLNTAQARTYNRVQRDHGQHRRQRDLPSCSSCTSWFPLSALSHAAPHSPSQRVEAYYHICVYPRASAVPQSGTRGRRTAERRGQTRRSLWPRSNRTNATSQSERYKSGVSRRSHSEDWPGAGRPRGRWPGLADQSRSSPPSPVRSMYSNRSHSSAN